MKFDLTYLDLTRYMDAGQQPVIVQPRTGIHLVPISFPLDEFPDYALTRLGDSVRVPMWAVRTPDATAASVFAVGTEVGVRVATKIAKSWPSFKIESVHVLIGSQVTDLRPEHDCFRVYFGANIEVSSS